jgi:hypothetical protein
MNVLATCGAGCIALLLVGCAGSPVQTVASARPRVGCDSSAIAALRLDAAHVTSLTRVAPGPLAVPGTQRSSLYLPEFCRVRGEASPAAGWTMNPVTALLATSTPST